MADPVSWFLISPGWKVVASDGDDLGEVDEVIGDSSHDIFDGLSIAMTALGKPRYVPAEQVATITDGEVRLSLTRDEVEHLGEYLEPPTSAQIEPDDHAGAAEGIGADVREVEAKIVAPTKRRERSLTLIQRIAHFIRRVRSRRD